MNRETKYRIRLKAVGKGTGYDVGEEITIYNDIFNTQNGLAFFPLNKDWEILYKDQYTGIKDKNGTDIYEGDIVKYTFNYYRKPIEVITDVYWNYHGFYIRRNETKLIDSRALMAIKRDGEIIGNIYEQAHLLNH